MNVRKMKLIIVILLLMNGVVQAQNSDVFAKDVIKANMLKVANWQINNRNGKPENDWTNGAFYTGVFAAYQTTGSNVLLDSMLAMGERKKI